MADAAKSGIGDIRCHQMSPDVRIITENQAVILLFKCGHWNKIWSEKTSFCVNVAWQSEFMRILCSSEQSKLCPCRTKDFCPTRTNLPAEAGDFSPKSKNPIKGDPDVNLDNRTKRLLLVAFLPKRRNRSYGSGTYKTVFYTGGKKRLSIFVPFKGWRIWWIWHTNTMKKVWNMLAGFPDCSGHNQSW